MSNEAEYMNLDVKNTTSKVETCIHVVTFLSKQQKIVKLACQIRDIECEKQKVSCTMEKLNHEINTVGCRIV